MTPRERSAAWRAARPLTQDPTAQRQIVQGWVTKPETCPYTIHRASYEIRSARSGRKQAQLLTQGVRLSRAVVTWYLLHGEYQHPDDLEFAPRQHSIAIRYALD